MNKYIVFFGIILLFLSCQTYNSYTEFAISVIEKYLAEGVELSDVPPAEGYHSPKQAVGNSALELAERGELNYFYNGEYRGWLTQCNIEKPITVYDFNEEAGLNGRCDIYYVIYGNHPRYGTVGDLEYKYNGNPNVYYGYHSGSYGYPRFRVVKHKYEDRFIYLSKSDAIEAFKARVSSDFSDPIAVRLTNAWRYDYYTWYFEVPDGNGSYDEYLMSSFVRLNGPNGVKSLGIENVVKIEKLAFNLDLYDKAEKLLMCINTQSFDDAPAIMYVTFLDLTEIP